MRVWRCYERHVDRYATRQQLTAGNWAATFPRMPKRSTAPAPLPPATKTRAATPPPPSFSTFARLSRSKSFPRIADRAIELRKLVAIGDAAKEELRKLAEEELEPELLAGGVGENVTIDYNGVRVRIADEGSGSHIDAAVLMRLKVSKKVIEEATVPNKRKHYVSIELPLDTINSALREVELPEKEAKRARREGAVE